MNILTDKGLVAFWNKIKQLVLGNRPYEPTEFSGKGYKVLEKNIQTVDGVKKNILTAVMINQPNTIYEIRYDFDLNGETIEMKEGCVLEFNGGSLKNGKIVGNNTDIKAAPTCVIFNDISFGGEWVVATIYVSWMHIKDYNECKKEIQSILYLQNENVHQTVVFPPLTYCYTPVAPTDSEISHHGTIALSRKFVYVVSNTTLIVPATFKVNSNNLTHYEVIHAYGENITIQGVTVIGDVGKHSYVSDSTSEWGMGVDLNGRNITLKDVKVERCIGDGIYLGGEAESQLGNFENGNQNIVLKNVSAQYNRRQGLSVAAATNNLLIECCNFSYTGKIEAANPSAGIDFEPNYSDTQCLKNIVIRDSIIRNNTGNNILFYTNTGNENVSIDNCDLDNDFVSQDETTKLNIIPTNGLSIKGSFDNFVVSNSRISFCSTSNIDSNDTSNIDFHNCKIKGIIIYDYNPDQRLTNSFNFYNCIFSCECKVQTVDVPIYIRKILEMHFYNCIFDYKDVLVKLKKNLIVTNRAYASFDTCLFKKGFVFTCNIKYKNCTFYEFESNYIQASEHFDTIISDNLFFCTDATVFLKCSGISKWFNNSEILESKPTNLIFNNNRFIPQLDQLPYGAYENTSKDVDVQIFETCVKRDLYSETEVNKLKGAFKSVEINNSYADVVGVQ